MRQKSGPEKQPAEDAIRDIRRATRRHFSAAEKIRVVLEGLRGEESIAELCRREGIASSMYYGWSKEFLEAGKSQEGGGLDDYPSIRRSRRSEGTKVLHFSLKPRNLGVSRIFFERIGKSGAHARHMAK
jgi:transposase